MCFLVIQTLHFHIFQNFNIEYILNDRFGLLQFEFIYIIKSKRKKQTQNRPLNDLLETLFDKWYVSFIPFDFLFQTFQCKYIYILCAHLACQHIKLENNKKQKGALLLDKGKSSSNQIQFEVNLTFYFYLFIFFVRSESSIEYKIRVDHSKQIYVKK